MNTSITARKLTAYLSYLIAAILVLLPFHALFTTWLGSNFNHLDLWRIWKEILIVFICLPISLWLVYIDPKLKNYIFKSWVLRLFVAYIILHIVMGWWAYSHHQVDRTALVYALLINLRFILFFLICLVAAATSSLLKDNWHKLLIGPAAAVIVFGLIQKLFLPYDFLRHLGYNKNTILPYQTVDGNTDLYRLQSTLRGANPLGAYLVLILTALIAPFKKIQKKYLALLIVGLVVMFFSYSRSALIGLIISFGFIAKWSYTKKIKNSKLLVAICVLVAVGLVTTYSLHGSTKLQDTILHSSTQSKAPANSNSVRWTALKSGLKDVVHQPLGRGPGTAGPASFRNNHSPRIAEDYYLQIGQEVGVLGIAIFVAINALVAVELWRNRQDQLAKILLASLIGITFVNLLSHAWTDDTLSLLWWGFAGIALAPAILTKKVKKYAKA